MISALAIALMLAAEEPPAPLEQPAEQPSAPVERPATEAAPSPPEVLPSSFAMYLSLVEPTASFGATGISLTPVAATLRIGAVLSGRHALLLGLSFTTQFGTFSGTTFSFMPTYRYFLSPLAIASFSAFLQLELFMGFSRANALAGSIGSDTIPFGAGVGFGGEYMVSRNFGVVVGAGVRFIHTAVTALPGGMPTAADQVGLVAHAALALHL